MLEDDFTYVLRKALRGLALSPAEAAARSHLPDQEVLAFSRGRFEPLVARKLASALGLDEEAFAGHIDYHPAPMESPGIRRLVLPFGGEHVNAWVVSKEGTHLLFDTGDDGHSCAKEMKTLGLDPTAVFLTHGHHDHIAGLKAFDVPKFGPEINGAADLAAGLEIAEGPFNIRTIDLSGHFNPALGYLIDSMDPPVLVAGDAIFAGSIGGCDPAHYHQAIRRIHDAIDPLPDETIILPGHGPATTVGEEKRGNPFLA